MFCIITPAARGTRHRLEDLEIAPLLPALSDTGYEHGGRRGCRIPRARNTLTVLARPGKIPLGLF
jgi:hypothetical protein